MGDLAAESVGEADGFEGQQRGTLRLGAAVCH
jgi:hypothetical protein